MVPQLGFHLEGSSAVWTGMGSLFLVDIQMVPETSLGGEGLLALVAFEFFDAFLTKYEIWIVTLLLQESGL